MKVAILLTAVDGDMSQLAVSLDLYERHHHSISSHLLDVAGRLGATVLRARRDLRERGFDAHSARTAVDALYDVAEFPEGVEELPCNSWDQLHGAVDGWIEASS